VDIEPLVGQGGLKRLAFLRIAMGLYGIERKKLAEQLGISYNGVNRWFHVDDIAISYIFKIAKLYDLKVKTTIKPRPTGN
jgi:transcriptional regulator with XRE-family HTH domain